jgi:hypothetical protein
VGGGEIDWGGRERKVFVEEPMGEAPGMSAEVVISVFRRLRGARGTSEVASRPCLRRALAAASGPLSG